MSLKIGAVSYLNTKPLIHHLPKLLPEADLQMDLPRNLANRLAARQLDVALIPVIEYFRAGQYSIVPGVSIASYGPVLSVKICSRVPFAELETLALDVGSRSSIALADILLWNLFRKQPTTVDLPMDVDPLTFDTNAVLVIGDRAMHIPDGSFPFTLDLGYEWSRWTGLPFVFAVWAVGSHVQLTARELRAFTQAKEWGRLDRAAIATREAHRLGLNETQARYYLEHVIRHDLGDDELAGLERFRQLAVERGLAPEGVHCVFHRCEHLAESR